MLALLNVSTLECALIDICMFMWCIINELSLGQILFGVGTANVILQNISLAMETIDLDMYIDLDNTGRHKKKQRLDSGGTPAKVQPKGVTSKLARHLIESWSLGEIGAKTVQKLAKAAYDDGSCHPDLVRLAELGAQGNNPGNCHRDLVRALQQWVSVPTTCTVQVPMTKSVGAVANEPLEMMPVHRMIAQLHKDYPKQFRKMFIGEEGALEKFWDSLQCDDPRLHAYRTKLAQNPDHRRTCVPLALHGDGVPVFRGGKSLYVVSATSLLASGGSVDQKFIIATYWSHLLAKNKNDGEKDTERKVWEFILWDLDVLWSGVHPDKDWLGNSWPKDSEEHKLARTPLANGYTAVPWILKGDLEYFANVLGLEHWSTGNAPCMACKVDRDQNPWTNHQAVGCLALQWTPGEWTQAHQHLHPLWRWGGLGHWSLAFDTMHVVSLGVAQHIGGNVLYELVYKTLSGTRMEKVAEVWECIKEYYKLRPRATAIGKLTLSMFVDKDAPHQHYPACTTKAKETEHLCRALAKVWVQYMDEDKEEHCHINMVLQHLVALYDLAGQPGLFMTVAQSTKMKDTVDKLLAHYNWLARLAEDNGQKRWNTVLKFHYLAHLALQCKFLHCKAGSTYLDEDFMGRIKTLARKSYCGNLAKCPRVIVVKYMRGCFVRWQAGE